MLVEYEISRLVRELKARTGRYLQIATSESATAGKVADRLTTVPGSSDYFAASIVAYSNRSKTLLLGVEESTLQEKGAVSEEVARQMARGGRTLLGVDVCVSDTGIAGPGGGSEEKPVGLFYMALDSRDVCLCRRYTLCKDREGNKRDASEEALRLLRDYLEQLVEGQA
ncbi:MAG: CinA family protein [Chloroflexota bacterium]